jgi:hypothetical protein
VTTITGETTMTNRDSDSTTDPREDAPRSAGSDVSTPQDGRGVAPGGDERRGEQGGKIEGEGSYTAARRHRKSAEQFVESGKVEPAARDAAPDSTAEEEQLRSAEEAGRRHAKR